MERITFECQVITPMFLAGADGQTPDLRPPSIKGAMRFWWRAVNGHRFSSIKEMKEEEGKIFGDQTQRSSFDLEVEAPKFETVLARDVYNSPVSKYFNFSLFLGANKYKKAIVAGTNFSVIINIINENYKDDIINSFFLLSLLGGLGFRSRRGSGSFYITNINDFIDNNQGILNYIKRLLNNTQLKVWIKEIDSNNNKENYYEQFAFYKEFRETKKHQLIKKAAFGLPLKSHFTGEEVKVVLKDKKIERYASRFFFTFTYIDKKLYSIITFFNLWALPKIAKVILFENKKFRQKADFDNTLLFEFIKKISDNGFKTLTQ